MGQTQVQITLKWIFDPKNKLNKFIMYKVQNCASYCTWWWVVPVDWLLWMCCPFHLWGYGASTHKGWSWISCPCVASFSYSYLLKELQALIPWQNSKSMAYSLQEYIYIYISFIHKGGGQSFSSSSSLKNLVHKREHCTTHIWKT